MNYLPEELKKHLEYDLSQCKDLEMENRYINVSDVLKAHYILADYFTDASSDEEVEKMLVGVRSYNLLASAVGRQCVEYGGRKKYTNSIDICSTLFFGLVKNHSFHDGNKRTALLILLYQLQKYGFYPKQDFTGFEELVVAVADNKLPFKYRGTYKKFAKQDDSEIKTISYLLRRMTVKKNQSFHMDLTTKEFCNILQNVGVTYRLEGQKIKFERVTNKFFKKKRLYTINFYGWTRPVLVKMVRDTTDALDLTKEYPSFQSMANGDSSIYRIICDFSIPLRRLKDE